MFGDEQDSLQKAASVVSEGGIVIPGAVWAKYEGFTEAQDTYDLPPYIEKLASLLAEKEQWLNAMTRTPEKGSPAYSYAFNVVKQASVRSYDDLPPVLNNMQPSIVFAKLASSSSILPLDLFCSYVSGQTLEQVHVDADYLQSKAQLPNLFTAFSKQASTMDLESLISSFAPASESTCCAMPDDQDQIDDLMETMGKKFSCNMQPTQSRTMTSIMQGNPCTSDGNLGTEAECSLNKMAVAYACYQLQTLAYTDTSEVELIGVTGANRFSVKKD